MGEQALETDGDEEKELELESSEEVNDGDDSEDEFEYVAEGEEKPASAPVPFAAFKHRVDKLTGKVKVATEGLTKAEAEAEMLREQVKLYQLKEQKKAGPPKIDDFDTDEEYEAAKAKYDDARVKALAEEKVQEILAQSQQTAAKQETDTQLEKKLYAHYEKVHQLKVSNYDESESNAIEILGDDIAKQIMANDPLSHITMHHLGRPANAAKAAYFKDLITKNPVTGLLELGGYISGLKKVSKRSPAPDPETEVEGGGGIAKTASPLLKGAKFE